MNPNSNPNQVVAYNKRGAVGYVTLQRPAVLNAMNNEMHMELACVWDNIEADDEIRVVVLSGSGERAFSVGQDLKELVESAKHATDPPSTFGSWGRPGWPRFTERFGFPKPVIAAVQGYVLGGGFELALACDVIVAAEDAIFALPEAKLGLIAGAGGVFRLCRQLPYRVALGYLLTGRRFGARRALEFGLINDVVPKAELASCADQWAEDIVSCAPLAVQAIKEVVNRSATMPMEQAFQTRYRKEERRMYSADAREGPLAFVEKRRPLWQGR